MEGLLSPTKDDIKSILKREYRREQEENRKERIFNPRQRVIGIDKAALDHILREKQRECVYKQKEEECFSLQQNRLNEMIDCQLKEAHKDQLRIRCELNDFRNRFQRKEQTREFDLNDPLYASKMTATDSFDWLGLDPHNICRRKLQQEQQKSWLNQQIHEKIETKTDVEKAEKALDAYAFNREIQLKENDLTKRLQCRKNQLDIARFNQTMAQAQEQKRKDERRHEQEDNSAEIMNNLCSDMLTENKSAAVHPSLFGGSRIIPSMFRGMTDNLLSQIRGEQLQQIQDKRLKQEKQQQIDLNFDDNTNNRLKLLELEDQEVQKHRIQLFISQNSSNMQLMAHQRRRNHYLNKEVYTFTPTDEFFDQFNTTSR